MTRAQKVNKLANAIREYRGATAPVIASGKVVWVHPPKKDKVFRVHTWLQRLRLDVADCLEKIQQFKSYAEFEAWLRTI